MERLTLVFVHLILLDITVTFIKPSQTRRLQPLAATRTHATLEGLALQINTTDLYATAQLAILVQDAH